MKDWRNTLIPDTATVQDAIAAIEDSELQIGLVVDGHGVLIGTVTDGDIRRTILRKEGMDIPVTQTMNPEPHVARVGTSNESLLTDMKALSIRQIPIIDDNRIPVDLALIDNILAPSGIKKNWVVLMAGGLGTRLHPLTETTPKPLLSVGHKPLLETILDNFIKQDFRKFYISVNYKSEMILSHFRDGSQWGSEIRYLEEKSKLGTAGALHLIEERPTEPVIVMNGDLLTGVNFEFLLDFHIQEGATATMCVREYDFQVPYGVVDIENHRIKAIDEKPIQRFFVNAGIYVLSPELFELIPKEMYFDMTTLFERCIADGHETAVFPIKEYWLDVGRMEDLERAQAEFEEVFKK